MSQVIDGWRQPEPGQTEGKQAEKQFQNGPLVPLWKGTVVLVIRLLVCSIVLSCGSTIFLMALVCLTTTKAGLLLTTHCVRFLIHALGRVAVAGPNNTQPKLMKSIAVASDEFHLIRNWRALLQCRGLKGAHEHDGAFLKHVPQRDVLAGKIIPIHMGLLHKEDFILVPAGDFDAIMVGTRKIFRDQHVDLAKKQSRFQTNKARGTRYSEDIYSDGEREICGT
jgi:hypothetical protein